MAKTIYTFIPNDDLNGSRIVTMDDCSCKVFKIIRTDSEILKSFRKNLDTPALYLLINQDEKKAYVGESDTLLSRLASHILKKPFWKEAFVFTANDDSIAKTECRYLEYLAYQEAKRANRYDLSENINEPTVPHMNFMLEAKTEGFFKNVLFLAKFVGCDIFESNFSHKKKISTTKKPEEIELSINTADLEGRNIKILLNGTPYNKSHFGYAIVKEFLKFNPTTNMDNLNEIFHKGLLGSWGHWNMLETDIDYAVGLKEKTRQYRHLTKEEYVLTSGDGIRFVVSNQWDKVNIQNLLMIAENQGWDYKISRCIN